MKNKLVVGTVLTFLFVSGITYQLSKDESKLDLDNKTFPIVKKKKKKKSLETRRRFAEERWKHEFNLQKNPISGKIPQAEKELEVSVSKNIMSDRLAKKSTTNDLTTYISRGPSNLGGRTRAFAFDKSDANGNTILAGGVSSGVFRTTDKGASWVKVSPNNQIHNVTTIAQDPREGFQNIWYYGTGEFSGNSASGDGAFYLGQGIWKSEDSGLTWNQLEITASTQESFDSAFDIITNLIVHPITGDLYVATIVGIIRISETGTSLEFGDDTIFGFNDIVTTSDGVLYAAIDGDNNPEIAGVWKFENETAGWTRIASSDGPTGWNAAGRITLAIAPSNENIVYALYAAESDAIFEAGLWQWNNNTSTWTDYTSKMPDEPGGDSPGNDPIAIQGGYDLVVSVKPDNENFVLIGGTNAYKIEDITTEDSFVRIGGYRDNTGYELYDLGTGVSHHPDIHSFAFDPNDENIIYTGTDGGVHQTADINADVVGWNNLNNNYQTYQYYNVAIFPEANTDGVIGGAQDNGTTIGGEMFGNTNNSEMYTFAGGDGAAVAYSVQDIDGFENPCISLFGSSQFGTVFRVNTCVPEGESGSAVISPNNNSSQFVTYFFLDPDNNNALYFADQDQLLRTSESHEVTSSSWENAGSLRSVLDNNNQVVGSESISQMATNWGTYFNKSFLLIGTNQGRVLKLTDPLNSSVSEAQDITPTVNGQRATGTVSGIAVDTESADKVMVTYSNYGVTNIYISLNANTDNPTWTEVERNLESFSIRSAAITHVNGQIRYFVGTARGLYSSTDPINEDWEIESPDQIGFALVSALAYRPSDNTLLIGTHGNGMYQASVDEVLSVEQFAKPEEKLSVFPNPVANELNISSTDNISFNTFNYSIFDISGSLVNSGIFQDSNKIAVNNLSSGIYILEIEAGNQTKFVKFIKQ